MKETQESMVSNTSGQKTKQRVSVAETLRAALTTKYRNELGQDTVVETVIQRSERKKSHEDNRCLATEQGWVDLGEVDWFDAHERPFRR